MKRALLHGFLGDGAAWDGVIGTRDREIKAARDGLLGRHRLVRRVQQAGIDTRDANIGGERDLVVALPGHVGGDPVRATWAENLDAIAEQIRGCDLAIGYSLGARVALGLLAMGAVPRAVLISVNPGIGQKTRAGTDEKTRAVTDEKTRAGIDEKSRAAIDQRPHAGSDEHSRAGTDERNARRTSDAMWARRFRTEPLGEVLDAWEAQPLFATQSRVALEILAARRARRLALDPEQIARSLEAMGLAEMPDHRAIIDGRCTLIVGADDAKYVAIARTLAAPLHVIDHCGHDPLLEQPAALAKVLASIT